MFESATMPREREVYRTEIARGTEIGWIKYNSYKYNSDNGPLNMFLVNARKNKAAECAVVMVKWSNPLAAVDTLTKKRIMPVKLDACNLAVRCASLHLSEYNPWYCPKPSNTFMLSCLLGTCQS
jgi:hypothetical protein